MPHGLSVSAFVPHCQCLCASLSVPQYLPVPQFLSSCRMLADVGLACSYLDEQLMQSPTKDKTRSRPALPLMQHFEDNRLIQMVIPTVMLMLLGLCGWLHVNGLCRSYSHCAPDVLTHTLYSHTHSACALYSHSRCLPSHIVAVLTHYACSLYSHTHFPSLAPQSACSPLLTLPLLALSSHF